MNLQTFELLDRLTALYAVTGFEHVAAEEIRDLLEPLVDEASVDRYGNVHGIRRCGKEGARTVMLDAHIDQIGFVVCAHEDGGFLRIDKDTGTFSFICLMEYILLLSKIKERSQTNG